MIPRLAVYSFLRHLRAVRLFRLTRISLPAGLDARAGASCSLGFPLVDSLKDLPFLSLTERIN